VVTDFVPHRGILKIVLTDEKGETLSQYSAAFQTGARWTDFPVDGRPAPVVFNNQLLGTAVVSISGRRIVVLSLIAFAVCAFLGITLALLAYTWPLKAVRILEGEILDYQRSLEEKVALRTRELQETTLKALALADQANAASRAKSEFLANMSHELRTPLNHIIGFTELVVDRQFGPLNDQQGEFLGDVLRSSRHLLALINTSSPLQVEAKEGLCLPRSPCPPAEHLTCEENPEAPIAHSLRVRAPNLPPTTEVKQSSSISCMR
jgi:signal transduction histidine kinase